jgi:hypothetical protein
MTNQPGASAFSLEAAADAVPLRFAQRHAAKHGENAMSAMAGPGRIFPKSFAFWGVKS